MKNYKQAFKELLNDPYYQSKIEEYLFSKDNLRLDEIYNYAYQTLYLKISFNYKTLKEYNSEEFKSMKSLINSNFNNSISNVPFFDFKKISADSLYIEKNKFINEIKSGTYVFDRNTEWLKILYLYIYKTDCQKDAVFFFGNKTEQPPLYYCRFYFNVKVGSFCEFILELTKQLDSYDLPFSVKHFYTSNHRIDNTVLYLHPKYVNLVYLIIQNAKERLCSFLRNQTPRFTQKIYNGIAFSESPSSGKSFGFNRCKVISDFYIIYQEKDWNLNCFEDNFSSFLLRNDINRDYPFLNFRTSHKNYIFIK